MKHAKSKLVVLFAAASLCAQAQQLAFPEAQGFGRFATGGRSGSVYHVTNLNDSGKGSLRDAVSQPNRIVVFDVAGVIKISSRIVFAKNLYVAGQTAPGEGVVVYGNGVSFSGASNIIVRHMRFRMGKGGDSGKDAAGISNGTNMIFDHCSFSWGLDETFSINPDGKGNLGDITISNSIMGQGLLSHSAGGLMQADNITLYRNLYCDNSTRNNKVKGKNQYVNNIVYNWKNGCYLMGGDSQGTSYANVTNNLFINGPMTGSSANAITSGNADFHIYAVDNIQDKNLNGVLDPTEISRSNYGGGPTFHETPFDYPTLDTWEAKDLASNLLPVVGASLPYRDMADNYMIREVRTYGKEGTFLSDECQLPIGAPSAWQMEAFEKPVDTDGDGMPDEWEKANGTDPNKDDAMTIAANGYANIENYINSISATTIPTLVIKPMCLSEKSSKDNSITLSWYDLSDNEDGFILELEEEGTFKEIARIDANTESYTIKNLKPGTLYNVRLAAFKGNVVSEYNTITAKTQPEYAEMIDCENYNADATWSGATMQKWNHTDLCWNDNSAAFADDANVLIAPATNTLIMVTEEVAPKNVVVKGNANVTLQGAGSIAGTGSLNKDGEGALNLKLENSYTGASVIHDGVVNFQSIADGGKPSALGASIEYAQNWIWDGGKWNYTGSTASTNRCATLYKETALGVDNSAAILNLNGAFTGAGNFVVDGNGIVRPGSAKFFSYTGNTIVKSGTLQLEYIKNMTAKSRVYLGEEGNTSPKLVMAGGNFVTKSSNDQYLNYEFPIEVLENTYSTFTIQRNCSLKCKVTGSGTLEYKIPFVREYVSGDWSGFYGTLVANGVNSDKDGSQLMLYNSGIPNASINLKGNARVTHWNPNVTIKLGGLSGNKGTYLGGTTKKTTGQTVTWQVGNANTNETFNGVIDRRCSASGYNCNVNIVKEGSGYWRLTGSNTYNGTTIVTGGRLIIDGSNQGTGLMTIKENGSLSGKGTIAGNVVVSGSVQADLSASGSCQPLTIKGKLTANNATLVINMEDVTGTIADDTEIKVFNLASAIQGTGFTDIQPATPSATQLWDTSLLATKGIIKVVSNVANGISTPSANNTSSSAIYDLTGKKTSSPKGLYIKDGKKHIAR